MLAGRAANAVRGFMDLVIHMRTDTADMLLYRMTDSVINQSGLRAMYEAEKGEKAQARIENLNELVTAAKSFEMPEELEDMGELNAFLSHAALEAGEGQADAFTDAVQLMTLHSAKGLEFPMVFMSGVEEGIFPSKMALDEGDRLDEERRLCYVGMTRAMQKLYISYAESRRIYGREDYARPSRFINEIPEQYVEQIRLRAQVSPSISQRFPARGASTAFSQSSANTTGFSVGQKVKHFKFAEGVVTNFEGTGEKARVQVNFRDFGSKWLLVSLAKLEAC